MSYPFLGMRGTGDWRANMRPESWREMILRLYPNGAAPLTAIMSKMASEKVNDPHFHWWTKVLANQRAAITGVYTNSGLSTAYKFRAAAGQVLYIKMAAADVVKFRAGHQVLLRYHHDPRVDVNAKITTTVTNGASSYIKVTLLEADDNSPKYDLSNADVVWIIGSINEEGATAPTGIMYDPMEDYNYTQIFRTTLSHTRTAMLTHLRTGDQVKEAKREALELHGIELEKALIFGVRSLSAGTGGKPERTTQGIKAFLTTNKFNYPLEAGVWKTYGEDWLDEKLEQIFRFGSQEKLGLCGSGTLLAINQLAKAAGNFELTSKTMAYGIKVLEWTTAFGTLYLKTHPLFTYEPTTRNSMLVIEPKFLKNRYITDTKYKPQIQANDVDGEQSEYLTECGLELHFEEAHGWFDGLGLNTYKDTTTTSAPTTLATTVPPTTAAP